MLLVPLTASPTLLKLADLYLQVLTLQVLIHRRPILHLILHLTRNQHLQKDPSLRRSSNNSTHGLKDFPSAETRMVASLS